MDVLPEGVTLGYGRCGNCRCAKTVFRSTKKGHICEICPPIAEGGCNSQSFRRSREADVAAAARVTKWAKPEYRKHFLATEPEDEPEPEPEDEPEQEPEDEPDPEYEDEPEPTPAPKPKPRPAAKPAPRPAPRRPVAKPAANKQWWEE